MGHRAGVAILLAAAFGLALPGTTAAGLRFARPVKLKGARDRSEPRIAITPDDRRWIVTSGPAIVRGGAEWVYGSSDRGRHWKRTPADPVRGPQPSFDLVIAATHTGRLIAIELDYAGISFYTSYSDDGGRHWTRSTGGAQSGDTDRPWLAVGPDDPTTHEPRVYLLYHNLGSGSAQHNMFVVTSRDGGAAIRYIWSTPGLTKWSRPVTVARGGGIGNVLPHVLAGSPGKIDFVYWHGVGRGRSLKPAWFTTTAQTLDGRSVHPHVTRRRVSRIPTYTGTASELMGACDQDPLAGIENGFVCTRSPDVFGVALDRSCRLTIAWPTRDMNAYAADQGDKRYRIKGNKVGTFASTQNGGTTLCGPHRKKKHRHHRHRHRCPDCDRRR